MNALESIILFSLIPNCLLRMLPQVFYEPYLVLVWFARYCYGLLVPKNKCLRRCGLICKRKQHKFGGTLGQVNKNCPFSRVRNAFSDLSLANRSNEAKNKLSSRQRNPSL